MKVLVCGGRDYRDDRRVFDTLDFLNPKDGNGVECLIHGGATGADFLAARWAIDRRVPIAVYPAQWLAHGKAAGPIRNQKMLDDGKPDLVLAFPGGRGTADMVRRARAAGVKVIEVPERASEVSREADIARGREIIEGIAQETLAKGPAK